MLGNDLSVVAKTPYKLYLRGSVGFERLLGHEVRLIEY